MSRGDAFDAFYRDSRERLLHQVTRTAATRTSQSGHWRMRTSRLPSTGTRCAEQDRESWVRTHALKACSRRRNRSREPWYQTLDALPTTTGNSSRRWVLCLLRTGRCSSPTTWPAWTSTPLPVKPACPEPPRRRPDPRDPDHRGQRRRAVGRSGRPGHVAHRPSARADQPGKPVPDPKVTGGGGSGVCSSAVSSPLSSPSLPAASTQLGDPTRPHLRPRRRRRRVRPARHLCETRHR